MSSPIVNIIPNWIQRNIVFLHQKFAHLNRVQKLALIIGDQIKDLFPDKNSQIKGLDIGCGDMRLVEMISEKNPALNWTCTDIHELPTHLKDSEKWQKYVRFNGTNLPFADNLFDVVVFSDVLHHCMPQAAGLLKEAKRVGKFIIIKDHFEHGILSRYILKLMDYIGNYGYGVSIPDYYFTKEKFLCLVDESELQIVHLQNRLKLYPAPVSILLRSELQFLSVLN